MQQADITNAVCDVLAWLRVDLVLVDGIHNLNLATRVGADASDQLKYLGRADPGDVTPHAPFTEPVPVRMLLGRRTQP